MPKTVITPINNLYIFKDGADERQIQKFIEMVGEQFVKDTYVFNKNLRKLTIKNKNICFYFRRNRPNLNEFVRGNLFDEVTFLDTCPNHRLMVDCYSRSEKVVIKRYEVQH